jgi:hypothetical protein
LLKKIKMKKPYKSRRDFLKSGALASSLMMVPAGLKSLASTIETMSPDNVGNTALTDLQLGILDVTKAPYNADSTGTIDSTEGIQQAVIDAMKQRLICFFPAGVYLISDTIDCEQPVYKLPVGSVTGPNVDDCGRYMATDGKTQHYWNDTGDRIILLGSTKGARPVLKLIPGSAGFQNSSSPKLAVKIWAQTRNDRGGTVDPAECTHAQPQWGVEQPNISFNHVFKGIDIDISGNPGAIGIRHTGSQGCYMMDSKIIADGALAGLNNCCGQGGGTYNIEVQGGQYGIRLDTSCRFPMLASCSFRGQTVASVYTSQASGGYLPLVLVGCMLETSSTQAADVSLANGYPGINLIDCVVKVNPGGVIVKNKGGNENVFLENVYTTGAGKVHTQGSETLDGTRWINITEYSSCRSVARNLVNGVVSSQTFFQSAESIEPDYDELHQRHWMRLPSFEDADAVNVKDFGAAGNNINDDTNAFIQALEAGSKVFVPKGTYKVSQSLTLGASTQLFGLPKAYTSITSGVTTVDDSEATTNLSFISIGGTTTWRAGKGVYAFASGTFSFSGNGGGRFYGLTGRKVIDGNSRPVSMYAYNVERVQQNPMSIIRNAKDVKIFYLKVEAGTIQKADANDFNTPMRITDSENVKIYAVCGNVTTLEQRPMVDVVNSTNVLVSQAYSFKTGDFPNLRETIGTFTAQIPSGTAVALYLRNLPLGITNQIENLQGNVYPNPFSANFKVKVPEGIHSIEVTDIKGRLVPTETVTRAYELEIAALAGQPAGVYFLKLIGGRGSNLIKLVKM